jgi:hypothetical protein
MTRSGWIGRSAGDANQLGFADTFYHRAAERSNIDPRSVRSNTRPDPYRQSRSSRWQLKGAPSWFRRAALVEFTEEKVQNPPNRR